MKSLLFSVIAFSTVLTGCATLPDAAKNIGITRNVHAVEGCTATGTVEATPPFILPNDDIRQVKSQALVQGADTILLQGMRLIITRGIAYKCVRS